MMNTKLSIRIFQGFLIFNILIGAFFGVLPLVNFPKVLELNGIPYADNLLIFGIVSGVAVLFLTAILIISLIWTRKGKWEGAITGILAGGYLLVVGIFVWIYLGDPMVFIMDSIRGFFTILFGYYTYDILKNKYD